MNWVVPFTAIASISAVLISAVITVISLRESPHAAIRRDVGACNELCGASESDDVRDNSDFA